MFKFRITAKHLTIPGFVRGIASGVVGKYRLALNGSGKLNEVPFLLSVKIPFCQVSWILVEWGLTMINWNLFGNLAQFVSLNKTLSDTKWSCIIFQNENAQVLCVCGYNLITKHTWVYTIVFMIKSYKTFHLSDCRVFQKSLSKLPLELYKRNFTGAISMFPWKTLSLSLCCKTIDILSSLRTQVAVFRRGIIW